MQDLQRSGGGGLGEDSGPSEQPFLLFHWTCLFFDAMIFLG